MRLSDFDYRLPKELIAQAPVRPRNHSRLLVYDRRSKQIADDYFYNLDKYLPASSTLVLNNSKVEKCRLLFGSTEIFVLHAADPFTVKALVRPGRKFVTGKMTVLPLGRQELEVETLSVDEEGIRILKLSRPLDDPLLDKFRMTPLPPYIAQDERLGRDYQTVYADPPGSKAAPTAGLHFTAEQLKRIRQRHPVAELTLHVGLGTFAPVKVEEIEVHKMHSERYEVSAEAADILNKAQHLTAIGTTSARTLESLSRPFHAISGETDIYITPGYRFKNVDALITNFHLPKSTLLMLVSALTGLDELQRIYQHAVKNGYRFYSFGDAMLVL